MKKYYKECTIDPHHGGFEMYERNEYNGERYGDDEVLLHEIVDNGINYYELGVDDLPEEIENILGKIYNQPDRVFGFLDQNGDCRYFGISEFEEEEVEEEEIE